MDRIGGTNTAVPVPVEVSWIADAVGEPLTFSFVEACAGQKLWVPAIRVERSNLARTWGVELAQCLSNRYGGEHYAVPMLKSWRIRRLAMMGLSHNDIVVRVGVSRPQIHSVLYGIRVALSSRRQIVDERQLPLSETLFKAP